MGSAVETPTRRRAIVVGGSLGGLFTGVMLERAGWEVEIFERSESDLDSRGGGIVLQPDVVRLFRAAGIDTGRMELGVRSEFRTVLGVDGTVLSKSLVPQMQTSWSLIYTTLRESLQSSWYVQGKALEAVTQDPEAGEVTAVFSDGTESRADLLVGADGNGSTVRRLLWPGVEPTYAGYLAWRGLVPDSEMPEVSRAELQGNFGFASARGSHMLGYLVPGDGNTTEPGQRLYNWVWYRVASERDLRSIMTDREGRSRGFSLPEGALAPGWREHVYKEAAAMLPPAFRAVVEATRDPFAQAIRDLTVERMVKGRVVLLGDAAFVPRPHTAASTSKAAANALALAKWFERSGNDVDRALERWEPEQLRLGQALYRQGTTAGNRLLFG